MPMQKHLAKGNSKMADATINNDYKTEQLYLYLCTKLQGQPTFGITVMSKLLFYIDAVSYLKTKKPISNFTYVRQKYGITPKPDQLSYITGSLKAKDAIRTKVVPFFGYGQQRSEPLAQPDLKVFSSTEIANIEQVLDDAISSFSATEISEFNHRLWAWKLANDFEEIPLYAYLITSSVPSPKETADSLTIVKQWENERGDATIRHS